MKTLVKKWMEFFFEKPRSDFEDRVLRAADAELDKLTASDSAPTHRPAWGRLAFIGSLVAAAFAGVLVWRGQNEVAPETTDETPELDLLAGDEDIDDEILEDLDLFEDLEIIENINPNTGDLES